MPGHSGSDARRSIPPDAGESRITATFAHMQTISLSEISWESWGEHAAIAEPCGLHVSWHLESKGQIRGDMEKLRLVLRNLFENAVNYCDEGGSIQIDLRNSDGHVVLCIFNTGCRLTPEEIVHVFERFWRGDLARSQTQTHCGLGLTLCKRIVEVIGGSISAQIARRPIPNHPAVS